MPQSRTIKKENKGTQFSLMAIIITAVVTALITSPISFFFGVISPWVLDFLYRPLEPEVKIDLNYIIIKEDMDSRVWDGSIKFTIVNLENKKTVLNIPTIKFVAPNVSEFEYFSSINKFISLKELETREDSISFSLEHSFKIENPDSHLYPYRILIEFDTYYPTGKIANKINYDAKKVFTFAFHYKWTRRSRKDFYYLKNEYEKGTLHKNWKKGEIYFAEKKYTYFYIEPNFRFKIIREGELFRMIIPNMTTEVRSSPKKKMHGIEIYRVKFVPDPTIEDKFPDLQYYFMPMSRTLYKKNQVTTDYFDVKLIEGYNHYIYVVNQKR